MPSVTLGDLQSRRVNPLTCLILCDKCCFFRQIKEHKQRRRKPNLKTEQSAGFLDHLNQRWILYFKIKSIQFLVRFLYTFIARDLANLALVLLLVCDWGY
jgi:hypothetical protein